MRRLWSIAIGAVSAALVYIVGQFGIPIETLNCAKQKEASDVITTPEAKCETVQKEPSI